MNALFQQVIAITAGLLVVSYGVMRLVVWALTRNGENKELRSWPVKLFVWGIAMSLLSLISLFATVHSVKPVTSWFLFYFFYSFPFIALYFLFLAGFENREFASRMEPPKKRSKWFYFAVAVELVVLPLLTLIICDINSYHTLRARLGWIPVGLALSSLSLNITVCISNRRCNLGARSPWSKFALIFAAFVAFSYPICHSFAVALSVKEGIDEDMLWIWSIFSTIIVGFLAYASSKAFYLLMNGAPWSVVVDELPHLGASAGYHPRHRVDSKFAPMDLYRSSYEEPNPYREEIYRQYDGSRRVSEDIQQFHESHPDADLSDHYSWEDILDAQTDGYLDDEKY